MEQRRAAAQRLAQIGHLRYCRSQVQMRRWDAGDVQNGVLGEQPVVERGHVLAILLSDLPQWWTPSKLWMYSRLLPFQSE